MSTRSSRGSFIGRLTIALIDELTILPFSWTHITLQLYRHRFAGVAEEMGVTLRRTAYSPNIKERLDFSCAVFDGAGRMIAQAAHIPAHLGAMPASVQTILDRFPNWAEGDVVIVNDPFAGGNHLPDITMISPVFVGRSRNCQSSIAENGPTHARYLPLASSLAGALLLRRQPRPSRRRRRHDAGSLPLSTEIYQEGIIIPPSSSTRPACSTRTCCA